jgi:tape measure domain-containing protein
VVATAGAARLEIVGDVSKLAAQLERDAERALRGVDLSLEPQLRELARDGERAFGLLERDADDAAREMGDDFQAGGEVAERAIDELRRSASRDFGAIQRDAAVATASAGGRFKTFGLVAGAALLGIAAAAAAGLGAIAGFGLKASAQLEQTTIGFAALLGSAEKAAVFMKEVQKFAASTPFEFQGIADASRRILAFGEAVGIAEDEVLPTIETIGSLVSVLGGGQEEIDAVTRAMGQMASKGKISQEELLQLAESLPGFSANAAIASSMGLTTAEAMEKISAGEVSATDGINALLEGMKKFPGAAGAMAAQAQTLQGVFSTFKDTISIALTDAFTPIIPAIKDALTTLTPVIGQAVSVLAPAIGQVITGLLPLVGVLAEVFTPVIVPVLDVLAKILPTLTGPLVALGGVMARLVVAVEPLIEALGLALSEIIVSALVPALDELIPQIVELVPAFTDLVIALIPIIPPLGQLLALFLRMQTPLIQLIALFLEFATAEGVVPLVELFVVNLSRLLALTVPFSKAFSDIANWPGMFTKAADAFSDLAGRIDEGISTAWAAVSGFFLDVSRWFRELPGKAAAAMANLGRSLLTGIQNAFGRARDAALGILRNLWKAAGTIVSNGLSLLVGVLNLLPGRMGNVLRRLVPVMREAISGAFRAARDAAVGGIQRLVGLIGSVPGRISALRGRMVAAGAGLIRGFLSGLGRVGGFIGNVAGSIVGAIKGFLNNVIGRLNSGIAAIDAKLPFSLPRVPQLAEGGLTTQGGLAELHANELVLPLQDRRAVDLLAAAMQEANQSLRAVGTPTVEAPMNFDVRVFLGDRELTDLVDVQISRRDRQLRRRVTAGAGRGVSR